MLAFLETKKKMLHYEKEKILRLKLHKCGSFTPPVPFHIKEVRWKEHEMIWVFWVLILRLRYLTLRT